MIRTVKIDETPVEINTSMGWLYAYRNRFGHDILPDLMPVIESVLLAIASVLEESKGQLNEKTVASAFNNDSLIDAFIKMSGMELVTVFNIFWAMAYNKDKTIPAPEEYMNTFERFPVDEVVPEMLTAIVESSVSSKNAERLLLRLKGKEENTSA